MVLNHKAGLPLTTFNASYASGPKLVAMGKQALHVAGEAARSLVGSVAGSVGAWFGLSASGTEVSAFSDPDFRVVAGAAKVVEIETRISDVTPASRPRHAKIREKPTPRVPLSQMRHEA